MTTNKRPESKKRPTAQPSPGSTRRPAKPAKSVSHPRAQLRPEEVHYEPVLDSSERPKVGAAKAEKTLDESSAVRHGAVSSFHVQPPIMPSPDAIRHAKQLAQELKQSVDAALKAFVAGHAVDDESVKFTATSKEFAKVILAERIRQSFALEMDPVTRDSLESASDKQEHAARVRHMLSDWNLALTRSGKPVQIHYLSSNTSLEGGYRLKSLGQGRDVEATGRWSDVVRTVTEPQLVDITDLIYRRGRTR